MGARDWFGVGVRLIGLWQITQALFRGFYAVINGSIGIQHAPPSDEVWLAALLAVLGLLLIVLADSIVRGVYGPRVTGGPVHCDEETQ
jgi:hypothetical protein